MSDPLLGQLQEAIQQQIPLCAQMGIEVLCCDQDGLSTRCPLAPNVNHQQTAFAGSINALCTVTGWGFAYLLSRQAEIPGDVVIRRSTIKYLRPVESEWIVARAGAPQRQQLDFFLEMLREKGQSKLDLRVTIEQHDELAVRFEGSYVAKCAAVKKTRSA